jgi:superfamily II DNA or RNA helicase
MLQCPTGFGKTVVASSIVQGALAKGKRVIFCVPALSLIDQTVQSFWDDGIRNIGVLQGQHELTNPSMPVQVASVQTLQNRRIPHADIVIVDEAHRWFKFYGEWMAQWSKIPFVGMSATPWTKGLAKNYDDLLIAATTEELINKGFLSEFEVYAPSSPDLSKVRTVAGDYHEGDLSEAMDQPALTADVVANWVQHGQNRPTLCFAVDCAHAKHLAERFQGAGVSTGYIDAYTDQEDRALIASKFKTGEVKVVCNVGCLTTGVDWDVRCIVLARPTKSEILFTQIIGRGLRTAEGKTECLIFDHTDTHTRLGFVTDIHHEELDDGKPKTSKGSEPEEKLPKKCSACSFVKPVGVHECPQCGFAPQKQTDVTEAEGKLEKLSGKIKKAKKHSKKEKQEFYSGLVTYAYEKNRANGWISHTYRDYFGVWPKGLTQERGPISAECRGFIHHKNIKFAKSRNAA